MLTLKMFPYWFERRFPHLFGSFQLSTFVRKTSRLARRDVVCCQRNGSTEGRAGKNSQVRLANNTTNIREVAMLQVDSFLIEKEEMTDVELLVEHIRTASSGCPDLANWPNHTADIDVPACSMRFKFGAWIVSGRI